MEGKGDAMSQEYFERCCSRLDALKRPVEDPEAIFKRVAQAVAHVELEWSALDAADYYEWEYFNKLRQLDFIPAPSVLKGAGKEGSLLLSDYVWPLEDSLDSLAKALKQIIELSPLGGSIGVDLSCLRPSKDGLNSAEGETGGPVEFLKLLDKSAAQQFPFYHKKHFALLNVNHPDILDFVALAPELKRFEAGIGISSHFMRCLKKGTTYPLLHPKSGKVMASYATVDLFSKITTELAKGEGPSVVYLDSMGRAHINNKNKHQNLSLCAGGNLALFPGETGAYGVINLSQMYLPEGGFDEERFEIAVDLAVRFLDNVLIQSKVLFPKATDNRKIGLGLIGLAPLLYHLKKPFSSSRTKSFVVSLLKFFNKRAKQASYSLAKQRGYKLNGDLRNQSLTALGASPMMARLGATTAGIGLWESWQRLEPDGKGSLEPHLVEEVEASLKEAHALEMLEQSLLEKAWKSPSVLLSKTHGLLSLANETKNEDLINYYSSVQKYSDHPVKIKLYLNKEPKQEVARLTLKAYEAKCQLLEWVKPEQATLEERDFAHAWETLKS